MLQSKMSGWEKSKQKISRNRKCPIGNCPIAVRALCDVGRDGWEKYGQKIFCNRKMSGWELSDQRACIVRCWKGRKKRWGIDERNLMFPGFFRILARLLSICIYIYIILVYLYIYWHFLYIDVYIYCIYIYLQYIFIH